MYAKSIASLAAASALMTSAGSQGVNLTGEGLRKALAGKTVVLQTSVGSIPISYQANGTMTGRARSMPVYVGPEHDSGTWWVRADQVCQKWSKWLDGKQHCFTVRLDGRIVHWRSNDGRTGTATIASN